MKHQKSQPPAAKKTKPRASKQSTRSQSKDKEANPFTSDSDDDLNWSDAVTVARSKSASPAPVEIREVDNDGPRAEMHTIDLSDDELLEDLTETSELEVKPSKPKGGKKSPPPRKKGPAPKSPPPRKKGPAAKNSASPKKTKKLATASRKAKPSKRPPPPPAAAKSGRVSTPTPGATAPAVSKPTKKGSATGAHKTLAFGSGSPAAPPVSGSVSPSRVPPSVRPKSVKRTLPPPPVSTATPGPADVSVKFEASEQQRVQDALGAQALVTDLERRLGAMGKHGDHAANCRLRVELALVQEILHGDTEKAREHYNEAHEMVSSAPMPIFGAKHLTPIRPLAPALALAQAERDIASDDATRAARWLDIAELHRGAKHPAQALDAYRQVLANSPTNPAALRGVEALLLRRVHRSEKGATEELADHLQRMASHWADSPKLAAWVNVQRAWILERSGQQDAALDALDHARSLDPEERVVRDAYARHLLLRGQHALLFQAWATNAVRDGDKARAARFEYAAGRLASERLGDLQTAAQLHLRASQHQQAAVHVRLAALRELERLQQLAGDSTGAAQAGEQALTLLGDGPVEMYAHRRLAATFFSMGMYEAVERHASWVLENAPEDWQTRSRFDGSLRARAQHTQRIDMWVNEAARLADAADRSRALLEAARVAEAELRDEQQALRLYRAAWAADSSNEDAFDGLSHLLHRQPLSPEERIAEHIRERISLYEQAAASEQDTERRLAYLFRVARLWEEEVGRPASAVEVFRKILQISPARRSALLGLQRCAARIGDVQSWVEAIIEESNVVEEPELRRRLLLHAARLAAERLKDNVVTEDLVARVLALNPKDKQALRLAWRFSYENGHYELALRYLDSLISLKRGAGSSFGLYLERAMLLEVHLNRIDQAVETYETAAKLDPSNPVPPAQVARLLIASGKARRAASALVKLAEQASTPSLTASLLVQAGELYDDTLQDDDRAAAVLTQAWQLDNSRVDVFERLVRLHQRRDKPADLVPLVEGYLPLAPEDEKVSWLVLLASVASEQRDYVRAAELARQVLSQDPSNAAGYRLLEFSLRHLEAWDGLAKLMFDLTERDDQSPVARLADLYELRFLLRHKGASAPESHEGILERMRALLPDDPFVHEALVVARGFHPEMAVLPSVIESMMAWADYQQDVQYSAPLNLAAALLADRAAELGLGSLRRKALVRYVHVLRVWTTCITAARGLARVAQEMSDTSAAVEALEALGAIESSPTLRAKSRAAAASLLLRQSPSAVDRAIGLLSKALRDDPDLIDAAKQVADLVSIGAEPGDIADILREALGEARSAKQAVFLGNALARIATTYLNDWNEAVASLRRARAKSPGDVPTLLNLADACAELSLWFEAADAAEQALGVTKDWQEQLHSLIVLAEAYAHIQDKWPDARRFAEQAEQLVPRLAATELASPLKRLAEVHRILGDKEDHRRMLGSLVAVSGDDLSYMQQFARLFEINTTQGVIDYVRELNRIITIAREWKIPTQPAWLVELGRLQVTRLTMQRDGVDTLRQAMRIDPQRVETAVTMAETLGSIGASDEAIKVLIGFLRDVPPAQLPSKNVAAVATSLMTLAEGAKLTSTSAAAEELMAFVGVGSRQRVQQIQSRPFPASRPTPEAMSPTMLERHLLPPVSQGAWLRVAQWLEDASVRLYDAAPNTIQVPSRARLSVRSSAPMRMLCDRIARGFGELSFDIALDVPGVHSPRLIPGSPPCLLFPNGYGSLPPSEQAAGVARLMYLVAMRVPWAAELSDSDLDGWMLAAMDVARKGWDAGTLGAERANLMSTWRAQVAKAISRKARRAIDEYVDEVSASYDLRAWRQGVLSAAWKAAYVISGDWTATVNHMWRLDRALQSSPREQVASTMFAHPMLRDFVLFSLNPETANLVRVVGH